MTISVCMGTFNGAKYIEKQLESILSQTRKPDEVILCDDGSLDATAEIIRTFIDRNNLEGKWKLYVNEQNKGYPACYYHAMSLCTQDIVFLADQDDLWDEIKLEKMSKLFHRQEDVGAVVCKFGLINEKGERIRTIMAPTHDSGTGRLRQISIYAVFYKGEWPGMAMAYRREWYMGWAKDGYTVPHDLLISAKAAEEGKFWQLDETLAWHRRHENNAAKEEHRIGKLLNKGRKIREIQTYIGYLEEFCRGDILLTEDGRSALRQKQGTMQKRYRALVSGKMLEVVKAAIKDRRNVRLATVICDMAICRQKGYGNENITD